jgi:hypothetical protein
MNIDNIAGQVIIDSIKELKEAIEKINLTIDSKFQHIDTVTNRKVNFWIIFMGAIIVLNSSIVTYLLASQKESAMDRVELRMDAEGLKRDFGTILEIIPDNIKTGYESTYEYIIQKCNPKRGDTSSKKIDIEPTK